ncbi:MAG: hypothetical protein R8M45_01550 [Ghiorsea sp.]
MSNQPENERDIDDVLASLHAMLADKGKHSDAEQAKETLIQHASTGSASMLGLSSTPPIAETIHQADSNEESSDSPSTQESITNQHRILLTEALLAPTNQETLPLWVEQSEEVNPVEDEQSPADHEDANQSGTVTTPEQHQATPEQATPDVSTIAEEQAISINRDQLEQLVEVISRDVSRQLNQQMQELLPRLVSASLVRHLASLKKD